MNAIPKMKLRTGVSGLLAKYVNALQECSNFSNTGGK